MRSKESVFDLYAERYDEWFNKNRFAYLTELEALRRLIPVWGKGLEVGVGTGRFALPLNISVGIDPSQEVLSIAKKRGVKALSARGENLPFENGEFDWVLIMVTLCFVRNPRKVVQESGRVIKNGGKIIIGIIDKNSPLGKFYSEKESPFYKAAKFYSTAQVIRLLEGDKFKNILTLQTIFQPPWEMEEIDEIREGYGEGSFVAISGEKGK